MVLTFISSFNILICLINWLLGLTFMSYALERSGATALGLMEMRTFRNATLSASMRAYMPVSIYYNDFMTVSTWLLVAISIVTDWRTPALVNSHGPVDVTIPNCSCCWVFLLLFWPFFIFILNHFQHMSRNCMMTHIYASFFVTFLIHVIMLVNVLVTWRVPALVECPLLSMCLHEVFVISKNCKSYNLLFISWHTCRQYTIFPLWFCMYQLQSWT